MLSILIPIYNFDVSALVHDLHRQCESYGKPYEILLYDDASTKRFDYNFTNNKDFNKKIFYLYLAENQGRSKIRNQLSEAAKYDLLLFMDCDSKVTKHDFIKQYLDIAQSGLVICGGRSYSHHAPNQREYFLHWHYGMEREVRDAEQRQERPYDGFQSNNFLIPKYLFENILFDERLVRYGHEDTLFGRVLKSKQISMLHINNPLEHIGLEINTVFIEKSKIGVQNLVWMYQNDIDIDTRLLATFKRLKYFYCLKFYHFYYKKKRNNWIANLVSTAPDLDKFDHLKLGIFIENYLNPTN
jgi:glycosyltransferase involved in cell wall biosynthesis